MTTIGYVTDRNGAKPHLIVDGRADCPVVRGRCAIRDPKPLTVDNAPLVCKRCRPALLAAAELDEMDANQMAGLTTTIAKREWMVTTAALVNALRTPAERAAEVAAREAFAARFYAIRADLAPAA